jgi:hypothetical protein
MSANVCALRIHSTTAFRFLTKTKIRQGMALTSTLLLAIASLGQATSPPQQLDSKNASPGALASAKSAPETSTLTVPSGTSIALVLTHPIQSRYIHHGDDIYAQVISPITAGNQVVIPAGILVEGKVDKLGRNGSRGELYLQSMSITYPDGYVAAISGPITLESNEGYALKDPGHGRLAGMFALPAAGTGIGALIGHSVANTQPQTLTSTLPPGCSGPPPGCLTASVTGPGSAGKSTVIGAAVGGGIGFGASIALFFSSHNFFLDVGSPVEMVLPHPLTLEQDQVADAIRDSEQHPMHEVPVAQRPQPPPLPSDTGTCWTPGTPGTPGTDIPGTPAVGGSPGTPPIHIAGTPPTPPTPHPCP